MKECESNHRQEELFWENVFKTRVSLHSVLSYGLHSEAAHRSRRTQNPLNRALEALAEDP